MSCDRSFTVFVPSKTRICCRKSVKPTSDVRRAVTRALPTPLTLVLLRCRCHDACTRLDHDWDQLGLEPRACTAGPGPAAGTAHLSKGRRHRCSLKVTSADFTCLFSLELKASFTHLSNTDANAKMAAGRSEAPRVSGTSRSSGVIHGGGRYRPGNIHGAAGNRFFFSGVKSTRLSLQMQIFLLLGVVCGCF